MTPRHFTLERSQLPLWLQLVNRAEQALRRSGLSLVTLSEESLLASAREQTGLSDFGDPRFLVGLRILLDDFERHGNFTLCGRFMMRSHLLRILENRLRVEDDLKRHPAILDVPIERPLFIVGLPRTGTTLLHHLFGQIPGVRVPLLWELTFPSPPPSLETRASDPRIAAVRRMLKVAHYITPALRTIHPQSAQAPEECLYLLDLTFSTVDLGILAADTPRYYAWIFEKDRLPDYQYFRRMLQLLSWRSPGSPWILKSPVHLPALDALLAAFPDANVVQTHRDPRQVIGSMCSFAGVLCRAMCSHVDVDRFGQDKLSLYGRSMDRALRARRAAAPSRFFDVHYQDLVRDAIGTVRRIHEHFGYPLPPTAEARIRAWLSEHPQHEHGVHEYALEQFGLTPEAVDRRFAEYVEQFEIAREQGIP